MIEVEQVSKSFRGFKVLSNVSFTANKGELILLLGPNGSGKTTLIRCLMGLLKFTGRITIDGLDVRREARVIRRRMGYLPQSLNLYDDMTCYQILDFFSNLKGVDVVLEDVLEPLGLMEKAYAKIRELSGGMKQKLGFALAMLGDPDIFILDEPFNNLDAESRSDAIKLLLELRRREKTIIVSTHTISGLLPISDKIILMEGGRIIRDSSPRDMLAILNPSYKIHILTQKRVDISNGRLEVHPTGWMTIITSDLIGTLREILDKVEGRIIVEEPSVDELLMKIKEVA